MVKQLEIGKVYHIKWHTKFAGKAVIPPRNECALVQIDYIHGNEIGLTILASMPQKLRSTFQAFITTKTFKILQKGIHEVTNIKDLPLYLGWTYTSPELSLMIKQGTLEAVCK